MNYEQEIFEAVIKDTFKEVGITVQLEYTSQRDIRISQELPNGMIQVAHLDKYDLPRVPSRKTPAEMMIEATQAASTLRKEDAPGDPSIPFNQADVLRFRYEMSVTLRNIIQPFWHMLQEARNNYFLVLYFDAQKRAFYLDKVITESPEPPIPAQAGVSIVRHWKAPDSGRLGKWHYLASEAIFNIPNDVHKEFEAAITSFHWSAGLELVMNPFYNRAISTVEKVISEDNQNV